MAEDCCDRNIERLKMLWHYGTAGDGESLGIYRCRLCGKLWKIRFQTDPGTGRDHIWLKPGQSGRGYSFTHEEAAAFKEAENGG